MNRRGWSVLVLSVGLGGCDSAEVKVCHAEMQASQKALLDMDKTDPRQVESTLSLIERTLGACQRAGRSDEVQSLTDAKRQVAAHLDALAKRAEKPDRPQLTPERLAELLAKGDPDCPRGQGYEPQGSKQVVKCTGPQLIEMPALKAREHFERRGFRLSPPDPSGSFQAEFGANRYAFRYQSPAGTSAPSCLEVTGRPGTPWQEIAARVTGVHPDRIEQGKPVRVGARSVPVQISGDAGQWSVRLGDCGAAPAEANPSSP